VYTLKTLEHPPHGRVLVGHSFLVWDSLAGFFEGVSEGSFSHGIDHQGQAHDHGQGNDALGLFEKDRLGHTQGAFEESKALFHLVLVLVVGKDLLGWQSLLIEFIGGQDELAQRL